MNKEQKKPEIKHPPKDVDKNLNPETRTLLDEDFWVDATPQKVQDLIAKGADVNAQNKRGITAAHLAAIHGNIAAYSSSKYFRPQFIQVKDILI